MVAAIAAKNKKYRRPRRFVTVALALLPVVAGCAGQSGRTSVSPVPGPLYSEFKGAVTSDENKFGPFLAASLAEQSDSPKIAAEYYISAFDAAPESRFIADRAFSQLLMSGHFADATAIASRLVEMEDEQTDDLVRLTHALTAFKNGEWAATRERLEVQLSSGFGFLLGPLMRAWSYAAEGDIARADASIAGLLRNEQLRAIALEHQAFMADYVGDKAKARALYEQLLASKTPASLQPVVAYGHFLYREGEVTEARNLFNAQAQRYDSHPFLIQQAALILNGDDPRQVASSPNGAMAIVFGRLANEFAQANSLHVAVIYHRLAAFLTPELKEIHFRLGQIYEQLNNPRSAAEEYAEISPRNPLALAARNRRANALRQAGDLDGAADLFEALLKDRPDEISLIASLGDIEFARNNFAEGVARYSAIIDEIKTPQKNDWVLYFTRAAGRERLGDWQGAEDDLLIALELNPDDPNILNNLGYSWIDRGVNIERAKNMIAKAVAARPNDGAFADSLGWAYYLTGEYDRAVIELERAVRLEPTSATINDHLGDAYWQVGRRIEARFQWRHALEGDPDADEQIRITQKLARGQLNERS